MTIRIIIATVIACFLWVSAFAGFAEAQACQWLVSDSGTSNFRKLAVGPPVDGLRFGDFNGDKKTDVFAVSCP